MPEEEIVNKGKSENEQPREAENTGAARRSRRILTGRNFVISAIVVVLLGGVLALLTVVLYRNGVADNYVKTQFVNKMAEIGVVFEADVFRITINPVELELKNATFNDKISGEKLFFIRDAHLRLTVQNLYAWQLSRDISIDKTELNGAEVFVRFDENGKSNFSNLKLVEDQAGSRVNFKYESIDFSLVDSTVHFGDLSRKLSGNAKNVAFLLSPENRDVPDEQKRYKFDLTSKDSNFAYDEKTIEKIDIRATGIADRMGADISSFELNTPIGETAMSGRLVDWADPKYDFDIQSSVDLTQASGLLPNGTSLIGVGNFKGKVHGEGESWSVTGDADAASLRAGGVYLKALNVAATVAGTNSNYAADGSVIAEMLTFEDFRIDFLKAVGNVQGTGTDFRWIGELQAAAAKSDAMSLGGLYLSDALAEYKDKQFRATAGSGRVQKFSIDDKQFTDFRAQNAKFNVNGDLISLTASGAQAGSFSSPDFNLHGITGRNARIDHRKDATKINLDKVRAETAEIKGNKLRNVSVDDFRFSDLPASTELTANNLQADQIDINGAKVEGIRAPAIDLTNKTGGELVVYADKLRVAKIDAGAAVLGSLNIGGVRLTVRQGRVEARSNDIDAGNVVLAKSSTLADGGNLEAVKINKPVFVLEPSGRYRVTADMSLGGGAVGSIALGAARAKVEMTNDRAALSDLTADVIGGRLTGNAVIGLNNRTLSTINGDFAELDISKLLAMQGGSITPIEGKTTGRVNLTFSGTNFRTASGTLDADITANAGMADRGQIPVTGQVKLTATNGLFNVDLAKLDTEKSNLTASGRFDLRDQNSNLAVALHSTDANEIERLVRVLGLSDELEHQLDSMQVQVAGNLAFDGMVTGNLTNPTVDGKASLDSISMRGKELGKVTTDIFVAPGGVDLKNGSLIDRAGGDIKFAVNIPTTGQNNVVVKATLTNVNAGNLLAALPVDLPARIRDLDGQTTGTVDISGLPNNAQGEVNLSAARGLIAGQAFDGLAVKAVFNGTTVDLQQAEMRIGAGQLTAKGNFDRASQAFNFELGGKAVPLPLAVALAGSSDRIPPISGDFDFNATATGNLDRASTYNVNFSGIASAVQVSEKALGEVRFKGQTANRMLTADLTASLDGHPQIINASVNFGDDNLPFMVATEFNQSPVAPFLAFVPQVKGMPISGTATGKVELGGNLSRLDAQGTRVYSADNLSGTAQFSQLALQIQDTPLSAAEPILVRFNMSEIVFEKARFSAAALI